MKPALSTAAPARLVPGVFSSDTPPVAAGSRWSERFAGTLVHWQNRTTQRRHLREIDDRLLADMGLTRADAYHESRKPFWRA